MSFVNHAIVNPPVDRDRPLDDVKDVYMHVEEETDAGLIVSGAKVVPTTSSLTHYNFIANNGALPIKTKPFAFVCIVPTDARGVKLLCRPSYEMTAAVMGSPFDYPLSSRMDENDSILVFDKVFVPYENVFAYGDIDKVNNFFPRSGFLPRFMKRPFAVLMSAVVLAALSTSLSAQWPHLPRRIDWLARRRVARRERRSVYRRVDVDRAVPSRQLRTTADQRRSTIRGLTRAHSPSESSRSSWLTVPR